MVIELPVIQGGTEIGSFNIDTGEIYPNQNMLITWSCCLNGFCCKRFHIPVTDFDIDRIETLGYELDQIISDPSPVIRMPKNEFGSIEKNYKIKRKPFDNSCTFLQEDDLCGIHEFRPFGCRIYPFQFIFENNGLVRVVIHETVCHQIKKVDTTISENVKFLEDLLFELRDELNLRSLYFEKYGDQL